MAETIESQVASLVTRVEEQGIELASLRRAVVALGGATIAGGGPGASAYIAWHEDQLKPAAPPAAAEPAPAPAPAPVTPPAPTA